MEKAIVQAAISRHNSMPRANFEQEHNLALSVSTHVDEESSLEWRYHVDGDSPSMWHHHVDGHSSSELQSIEATLLSDETPRDPSQVRFQVMLSQNYAMALDPQVALDLP